MVKNRQKVKFELFVYTGNGVADNTITLPYKNFASIKFICQTGSQSCTINNIYKLNPYYQSNSASGIIATNPYEIEFKTVVNEIDTTDYKITLEPLASCSVIVKWYVD